MRPANMLPPDEQKRQIIENAIMAFRPDVHAPTGVTPGRPRIGPRRPGGRRYRPAADQAPSSHRRAPAQRPAARPRRPRRRGPERPGLHAGAGPARRPAPAPGRPGQAPAGRGGGGQGEQRLQRRHWQHWVHGTNDIFRFTTHERTLAACNDEQREWKLTPDGQPVYSRTHRRPVLERPAAGRVPRVCPAEVLAGLLHVLAIG